MSGLKLKLNTGGGTSKIGQSPIATPIATPGGTKIQSLKLKLASKPPTPSAAPAPPIHTSPPKPKKSKAGRATKPSAKLQESLKRGNSEDLEDDIITVQPPSKKLKLNLGLRTPAASVAPKITGVVIKPKIKGKKPERPFGEGYDSEASDREEDPTIEEEFILRMVPGDDCEYLRRAIEQKKIGVAKMNGGADVHMKFFHGDGRRAAITVRKNVYAATLVDLPTIIEGMKSWDKRGWWKSADICQMLWVFAQVQSEEEAKTITLPDIIDQETYQYPHGLTAPMHYARKRRFRKRISRTAIEAVEDAVDKLLKADEQAISSSYEIVDPDRRGSTAFSSSPGRGREGDEYSETEDEDVDAEGEDDDQGYFGASHGHTNGGPAEEGDLDDLDLEADLAAAMDDAEALETATPASELVATPQIAGDTPAAQEEDSGDESVEDEDDDDPEDDEIDDDEKGRLNALQGVKADITELEKQLKVQHHSLSVTSNNLLRKRIEESIRKIKNEIQLKKSSIGEGDEADE